ncbi:MAG: PQQ-binding-like beta-propeller repeat protein [Planctomycetota bacterium JB042]
MIALEVMLAVGLATGEGTVAWGGFRGPAASGRGRVTRLPERLDDETLRWRVHLPDGSSSPIVAGRRVFCTAATKGRALTGALDRMTGQPLWSRAVRHDGGPPPRNSPAAATPTTDGEIVIAAFDRAGVVAYAAATGKERWRFDPGEARIPHGWSSSPLLAGDRVVLQLDTLDGGRLVALDLETGAPLWETPRPHAGAGYASPALAPGPDGDAVVVVAGSSRVSGYALEDGQERWWVGGAGATLKGIPVVHGDVVHVNAWSRTFEEVGGERIERPWDELLAARDADGSGAVEADEWPEVSGKTPWRTIDRDGDGVLVRAEHELLRREMEVPGALLTIRLGGEGDVSESHVVWRVAGGRGVPDVPTPLRLGDRLLTLRPGGIVAEFDANTGERRSVRRVEAPGEVLASPVAGDGKVYCAWFEGVVIVLDAETLETVSTNDLGARIVATPALAGDQVFVRTRTEVLCFGRPEDR